MKTYRCNKCGFVHKNIVAAPWICEEQDCDGMVEDMIEYDTNKDPLP